MLWLVLLLACAAAFAFALSAMLEQRAATQATRSHSLETVHGFSAFVRALVRRKLWLTGFVINNVGFLIQAAALHLGSVALVQPVMVSQVLFALLLTGLGSRLRPSARDWCYVLCICAGLIVLLSVSGAAPLHGTPNRELVIWVLLAMAALVVLLVGSARGQQDARIASMLLAIAAGVCFAGNAVLTKLTVEDLFGPGVLHTALDWPGYSLAVATASGLLIEQAAFAHGTLPWAVAAMSITNPVISYLAGIFGFHVAIPHTAGALAAVSVTAVLIGIGISGLAHSPITRSKTQGHSQVAVPS
ncbi:DMT family transporter [Flexivirga oryzae]|uniref:Drug/metabolite transporter (DMT)-like permease n=1 Tax=Flexivirga oryzae TaxID=1794944 RepID=A0A839N7G9_9MICO|nr:DMT family transporter [Flexivirga oryzae]MBB2893688.1 drug/metabolite transporter (DMT)-like permease [Flexivirga oryzae]